MTEKRGQNSPKSHNAQPSGSYSSGSFNQAVKGSSKISSASAKCLLRPESPGRQREKLGANGT
jgi:hypothetical protein